MKIRPGRYVLRGCICGKNHVAQIEKSGRGLVATWVNGAMMAVSRLERNGWHLGRRL